MNRYQYSLFKNETNTLLQELQVLHSFLEEIYTDLKNVLEETDEAFCSKIIEETIIRTLKEHSEIYYNLVVNLANHLRSRLVIEGNIKKASSGRRKAFFFCSGVLLLGSLISGGVVWATHAFDFSLALYKQPYWFISSVSVAFFFILLFLAAGIHYGKLVYGYNQTNKAIWSYESNFIRRYLDPFLNAANLDEKFHRILKQAIWNETPQIQQILRREREKVIRAFESKISTGVLAVIFLYAEDKLTFNKFDTEDFLSMARQYNRPQFQQEPLYLVSPRHHV